MSALLSRVGPLLATIGWLTVAWLADATELHWLYTVGWISDRIPYLVAPLAIAAALTDRWRGVACAALGYVLGVVFGELIGEPVYQHQTEQLRLQKLDPAYTQNWEPSHPGWAISLLVYWGFTLASIVLPRLLASTSTPGEARHGGRAQGPQIT